ncbi:hypothetical protein [Desulfosarcina variabilis]|uniref:hypothetical protein n=1 Tax=Desulfosarcina variabilis TaxID=2300 RepID=UPI003AFAF437
MRKGAYATQICNAITEIRENLSSGAVKSSLLIERLKKEEQRLLNELYEEFEKKGLGSKRTKITTKQKENHSRNPSQGGRNEVG